ncbi:sodium-coupled neutral amino acid transporter 9 homolog isoform X2 [Harmonia axyridis]|uniref:sodium-coupled neutral amino acid transporter 9 homolog isoform X2 n=1 Tax=Harmonia axyridis TaxID=115357 RepID=UPI001E278716|nr:sodium-coupled neutral amino acid transporter 9 homolog isoform X2 [Harmonia axyridis]
MATEKTCQILSFTQLMDVNFNNKKTVFGVSDTEQSYNGSCDEKMTKSKSIMPISTKILKKQLSKKYSLDLYPSQILDAYLSKDILSDNLSTKKRAHSPFPDSEEKKEEEKKNSSVVTIFAVWNTMLGSSLLAISWGIEKTGLFPGIILNFLIGAICLYTAYLLLRVNEKHSVIGERCEVPELCRMLLGRWAEVLAKVFSMIVLFGANIVYWILMSNFLYNLVYSIHGFIYDSQEHDNISVICPKEQHPVNVTAITNTAIDVGGPFYFDKYWNLYSTVPVILAFIIFPLLNFKNAQIFMRFNSLGTISIVYLIGFSFVKFFTWGINWPDVSVVFSLKPTFAALSGMLTMSYFIHNIIISMMKNNRHQENNGRDLTIAFALVTFTYSAIGGLLYISFPLSKWCIEDNILNNFGKFDKLVLFGRALLFFQLSTVFPLLAYMLRKDIFSYLSFLKEDEKKFRYIPVIIMNAILVVICILFACFIPRIGTIIRYIGALSGMVYVFMMPNLLNIYSLRKENKLTSLRLFFHVTIIVIGILNLLSQFIISDD